MKTIIRKIPGGKLVRIDIACKDGHIAAVRITGDFFLHPEERITLAEQVLLGARPQDAKHLLQAALAGAQLIGASIEDIDAMIQEGCA